MNEKELKEFFSKTIDEEDMRAVWFPKDWQKTIVKRAKKENMSIYKYLMMTSNNYQMVIQVRKTNLTK